MNLVPADFLEGVGGSGRIAGFRPEHVELDGKGDAVRLTGKADVVEYLGDEQLVHFTVRDRPLLAKLPVDHEIRTGEDLALAVPREKLHLFDAETEEAVRSL